MATPPQGILEIAERVETESCYNELTPSHRFFCRLIFQFNFPGWQRINAAGIAPKDDAMRCFFQDDTAYFCAACF
jgi:hypothetical protein